MSNQLVCRRKTGPGHNLKFQKEALFVNKENYLNIKLSYRRDQKIKFICSKCKKESLKQLRVLNDSLLCTECINLLNQKSNLEKIRKTKLEKYGNETYNNPKKRIETIKNLYDKDNYSRIYDKTVETKKQHSLEDKDFNKKIQEKKIKTILSRFKSWENYCEIRAKKSRKTKLEKYGNETYNNQEKRINTMIKNKSSIYGYRYVYKNLKFSSSWELLFYIYHIDNNSLIERNESFFFIYYDYNGKSHKYFPDFKLNGQWIEIKGNQFFNKNGETIKTYLNEDWTPKYSCMVDNNVKILLKEDLKDVFKYCANKYSNGSIKNLKKWCKQFVV